MRRPRVVIIGPMGARGGIATVVNTTVATKTFLGGAEFTFVETSRYHDAPWWSEIAVLSRALVEAWRAFGSRPDLAHIHASYGRSFFRKSLFVLMARARHVPVILHIHASKFEPFFTDAGGLRGRAVHKVLTACADVVVLSDRAASLLAAAHAGEVSVDVVRNPVSLPQEAWGVALGDRSREGPPVAVFMGFLIREKGVGELLAATSMAVQKGTRIKVDVFGKGPCAEEFETHSSELGLGDVVQFRGWVDGDAKTRAYANADIFVLPSHYEGMPMAMLEAMACGLPVVCTRVGAVPEIIRDGREGLLCDVGDVVALCENLTRLAEDARLRMVMGKAARDAALEFAPERIARRWLELYDEVRGDTA